MTGIAWSYEDPSAAAKVVKAFRKDPTDEKLKIKAGLIDGTVLAGEGGRRPARDDARQGRAPRDAARDAPSAAPRSSSQLLQAPAQNFVYLLTAKERRRLNRSRRRNAVAAQDNGRCAAQFRSLSRRFTDDGEDCHG